MRERSPPLRSLADVTRSGQQRDEHARDWLTGACQEAITTDDLDTALDRFLRLDD